MTIQSSSHVDLIMSLLPVPLPLPVASVNGVVLVGHRVVPPVPQTELPVSQDLRQRREERVQVKPLQQLQDGVVEVEKEFENSRSVSVKLKTKFNKAKDSSKYHQELPDSQLVEESVLFIQN